MLVFVTLLSAGLLMPQHPTVPDLSLGSRTTAPPRMILGLPRPPSIGFWPSAAVSEVLYEEGARVDFCMENVAITKRRVSGGLLVDAPPEAIWQTITNYESLPDVVPNILANSVDRRGEAALIRQTQLISRRLNLVTEMTLEAVESPQMWELALRRVSGHGFLEFEASYKLAPRSDGGTYLSYSVNVVPCPIFPMPLVEAKIRKEVPKMLIAVRDAALDNLASIAS